MIDLTTTEQAAVVAALHAGELMVLCAHITTKAGEEIGWTNHTRAITYQGLTYISTQGFDLSKLESSSDLAIGNMEINTFLLPDIEQDVLAGRLDDARIEIFSYFPENSSLPAIPRKRGYLGEFSWQNGLLKVEMIGLKGLLQRKQGRTYEPECNAVFGDTRCIIPVEHRVLIQQLTLTVSSGTVALQSGTLNSDLGIIVGMWINIAGSTDNDGDYKVATTPTTSTFTVTGGLSGTDETAPMTLTAYSIYRITKTIASLNSFYPKRIFTLTDLNDRDGTAYATEWFRAGLLEFLDGDNRLVQRRIRRQHGTEIELHLDVPFTILVGAEVALEVGCDKKFETCRDKFSNITNFRGFRMPKQEEVFGSPVGPGSSFV